MRAALLCVASDSPASRKMSGFLAHSALLRCIKCKKVFKGKVGEKDYSGFRFSDFVPRAKAEHNRDARKVSEACNITQKKKLETKYGCRYSVLIELVYFGAVRFTILAPMHLLFLGVAKHIFIILIEREILTPQKLADLEKEIRSLSVPYDVGRLPKSIASNLRSFTAQEFKALVLQYGPLF